MMTGLASVGYFISALLFNLGIFILWMRLAVRYFHISSLHPVGKLIHRLTDPILHYFPRSKIVWACFGLLILLELMKFMLLGLFIFHGFITIKMLLVYTIADLVIQPCNFLFYALVFRVILSWVNPTWRHPIAEVIHVVTEPLLKLGHRLLPPFSGFDFSPFLIIILLKAAELFVTNSLAVI